ncbi:MAG TPA: metalloregulator ArsR/SmtB family transcription factor [Jatrophihabitans sp.]|nr:metalloregulator ArsR/SmtB family transcription factor [Jatrophihabitans sp.]
MNSRSGVALADPAEQVGDLAAVFGLLADPGRLRILLTLRSGEANVGELAEQCGLSESATSHALRLLRSHGVVRVRRSGRLAFYSLADQHVQDLLDIAVAHAQHAEHADHTDHAEHAEHAERAP